MALNGYEQGAQVIGFADIAAGTDVTNCPVLNVPQGDARASTSKIQIKRVLFGTQTTVTGSATHYVTVRLKKGSTTIAYGATVTSGLGTITGGVWQTLTLKTTNAIVTVGNNLVAQFAHSGSGTAVVNPRLQLEGSLID